MLSKYAAQEIHKQYSTHYKYYSFIYLNYFLVVQLYMIKIDIITGVDGIRAIFLPKEGFI